MLGGRQSVLAAKELPVLQLRLGIEVPHVSKPEWDRLERLISSLFARDGSERPL